uniref:Uncharacterized protein n=1 Tax=Arundo donax TaxID=35708 RepID=A0A0A8YDR8_ARUDO
MYCRKVKGKIDKNAL